MVAKPTKKDTLRKTPLQIRLTAEEKVLFTQAADREHMTLSAWIRLAALHAAKTHHRVGG